MPGQESYSAVNIHPLLPPALLTEVCNNSSRKHYIPLQTTSWKKLGQKRLPEFILRVWSDFWCYAQRKGLLCSTRAGLRSGRRRSCTDHATFLWFDASPMCLSESSGGTLSLVPWHAPLGNLLLLSTAICSDAAYCYICCHHYGLLCFLVFPSVIASPCRMRVRGLWEGVRMR